MDMEDIMRNEHNSRETDSGILYFTTILDDMWRGFKKFFLLCLIIIAACGAGFYFRAKTSYKPSYQAYSSFVVDTKTAYVYNQDYSNEKTAGQLSKTFPYILTSGALSDIVAERSSITLRLQNILSVIPSLLRWMRAVCRNHL